jgi:hypothetical protein
MAQMDLQSKNMASLLNSAKQNWHSFWPAWAFPVLLIFGSVVLEHSSRPLLIFIIIFIPLFFWSFFRATRPWMRQEIKYSHFAFWVILVPFSTWCILVFLKSFLN